MIEVTLQPTPRLRDVVLEQVRIVGLSLRREALIAIVVLGIATLPLASEIVRGGPGFDSNESFPTAIVSFLFPFLAWRGERRFGPAFLWTLPVDRRRLALSRVFGGFVWLMAALAVFISWLLMLALLAHASPSQTAMRIPYIATIAMYLLGSALVLGLRHPLRWLFGAAGVFLLLGRLSELFGSGPSDFDAFLNSSGFVPAVNDAAAVWSAFPQLVRWAITTFLWFGSGLAALWAAVSRHKENR
jgi:hypothetical protein